MEHPIKMDDLGVSLFLETSMCFVFASVFFFFGVSFYFEAHIFLTV